MLTPKDDRFAKESTAMATRIRSRLIQLGIS